MDTSRRIYSPPEKLMNLIAFSGGLAALADGGISADTGPLPRGEGHHVVGGTADLKEGKASRVAIRVDASSGASEVFWRDADGAWHDVTARAKRVTPRRTLAKR